MIDFDHCFKVEDKPTLYLAQVASMQKVAIKHWEDYVDLGSPEFEEVTQDEADRFRTVPSLAQGTENKPGKVLIVIPTLDRPEMCARAVESVLRQKYKNWYLVVAINGFPEYTCDWEEKEQAYRKAIGSLDSGHFMSIQEAGLGHALNSALSPLLSKRFWESMDDPSLPDYWMNLEDDDELDTNYLEVMVAALEESGADVANCLQRQLPKKVHSNGGVMDTDRLQRGNWINWPMCLWRREVYEKVGSIAEDVGPAADWDYHLRCVAAGIKYHFVDCALVTHHWHGGNYCLQVDGKGMIARKKAEGAYGG